MSSEHDDAPLEVINTKTTTILLPVKETELGRFLAGLLGQPQSVEREFIGAFDIDHLWLLNLHALIDQRVRQQAEAQLLGFKAVILFSNRMKRTLTSIEAFHAQKIQQVRSVGIQMEWSYLIRFPHSQIPERQGITFSARAEPPEVDKRSSRREPPEIELLRQVRPINAIS